MMMYLGKGHPFDPNLGSSTWVGKPQQQVQVLGREQYGPDFIYIGPLFMCQCAMSTSGSCFVRQKQKP